MRTLAHVDGSDSAQLMIVVGTNYDTWEENLSLALKLHAQLETACPGITRPLQLRGQRFNEDLSPGALLIEVGAAGELPRRGADRRRGTGEGHHRTGEGHSAVG